jgi:hypothetical protein
MAKPLKSMTRYLLLGIFTLLGALAMPETAFSAGSLPATNVVWGAISNSAVMSDAVAVSGEN